MKPASDKVLSLSPSGSIAISTVISKRREEGADIIGLNVGEPDFLPHPEVIKATQEALGQGKTRYSAVSGEKPLRQSLAKYLGSKFLHEINETNILISNGSKQVLYSAFQYLLNKGDEVIVPVPYWVTIPESIKLAEGVPVPVEVRSDFHLDIDAIKNSITDKTKAIYINTPNNPTGVVYHREELEALAKLVIDNDLMIVSDEAYESLVYDGEFISPLSLGVEVAKRTLCIQSFSKTFSMSGYRLGYMVASSDVIKQIDTFQGHVSGNIAPFSQYGAIKALELQEEITGNLLCVMKERREVAYNEFKDIFNCPYPTGAFYLFGPCQQYYDKFGVDNDADFVMELIKRANVAFVPGSAFGMKDHLRIAYCNSIENIKEAAKRVREVLK